LSQIDPRKETILYRPTYLIDRRVICAPIIMSVNIIDARNYLNANSMLEVGEKVAKQ